jgi:CubicO group peptidase (beta-lactamase class C family)
MVDGEEKPVHFGLGWGKPTLMHDIAGSKSVVSHGGAVGTRIWVDHDAGLVIVFFSNQWSPDRSPENEAIAGVYEALGTPYGTPPSSRANSRSRSPHCSA